MIRAQSDSAKLKRGNFDLIPRARARISAWTELKMIAIQLIIGYKTRQFFILAVTNVGKASGRSFLRRRDSNGKCFGLSLYGIILSAGVESTTALSRTRTFLSRSQGQLHRAV